MKVIPVEIGADTPGQSFQLRVLVFEGTGEGRRIYMQAALHAGEMPGVAALDALIPMLVAAEADGRLASRVTVVPFANPIGLSQAVQGVPLGRFDLNARTNFNRDFATETPGDLDRQTVTEGLKAILLDMAAEADVVLDLHCDEDAPLYLYVSDTMMDEARLFSAALGVEGILYDSPGAATHFQESVYRRWDKNGALASPGRKFVSTVEYRGMLDVTPALAEADATGLMDYLIAIGAVRGEMPKFAPNEPYVGHVDDAVYQFAPVGGALMFEVGTGEMVRKGQRLARIIHEPGRAPCEIVAPDDGWVMARSRHRIVRRGTYVIKVLKLG